MSVPVLSWSLVASRSQAKHAEPPRRGPAAQSRRSQHVPRKDRSAGPSSSALACSLAQSSVHIQARFPHWPDWPDPQSQSLSRSYGSNLPTSLSYIILSTRGCSPWRPAADMGTSWRESAVTSLGFSRSHRTLVDVARTATLFAKTKTRSPCERIPGPQRLMQKRQLFPELRWKSPSRVTLP